MYAQADLTTLVVIILIVSALIGLLKLFGYAPLLYERRPSEAAWAAVIGGGFMGSLAVWLFYPMNPWGLILLTLIFTAIGIGIVAGLVGYLNYPGELATEAAVQPAKAMGATAQDLNRHMAAMVDAAAKLSGQRDADIEALKRIRESADWVFLNRSTLGADLANPDVRDRARRVVRAIAGKNADDGITISEVEAAFGIAST